MTCGRYESWIALAAGGDLHPRRVRRLEQHLAACENCREYAAAMADAREAFHALGQEVVWDADVQAVRTAVMSRVAEEQHRPRSGWRWMLAPAAATAALILMLWSGVIEPRPFEERGPIGRVARPPQAEGVPHPRSVNETALAAARQPLPRGRGSASVTEPRPSGSGSLQSRHDAGLAVTNIQSRAAEPRYSRTRPAIQVIAPRDPDGDIVVRLETSDPKVVIYWVMQTGETE